jgi:hypothetical protein
VAGEPAELLVGRVQFPQPQRGVQAAARLGPPASPT